MCNEDDFLVLKKNRKRQIPERAALMLTHIDFGSWGYPVILLFGGFEPSKIIASPEMDQQIPALLCTLVRVDGFRWPANKTKQLAVKEAFVAWKIALGWFGNDEL